MSPTPFQAAATPGVPVARPASSHSLIVDISQRPQSLFQSCSRLVSATTAAEHLQQRPGVHPLLPSRPLHIQAHVPEDLSGAHLLARGLVVDGRARGVALGPRAAVYQVEGAAPARWGPGPPAAVAPVAAVDVVALLQAAVPALEGSGERGALHPEVDPVAAEGGS